MPNLLGMRRLLLTALPVLLALPSTGSVGAASPQAATSVVAVVGDEGIDFLHEDFAAQQSQRLQLPREIQRVVVPVSVPLKGTREERLAVLARGPLGKPQPRTLYWLKNTRVLLWTGATPGNLLIGDAHGTGTASAAAGRRDGTARQSWLLMTTGYTDESWSYVASQPWVDAVSSSVFEPIGTEDDLLCDSAEGISGVRASGRLAFVAAGNGPADSSTAPAGAHPAALRVGGVRSDGSSALPQPASPTSYSAREYDIGERYTNLIAVSGTSNEYREANGTSGSSPRLAGRVADLLRVVRAAVGDRGTGSRSGALVVVSDVKKRPAAGPLVDGSLTVDELEAIVLGAARPSAALAVGRYAIEGYGWFDEAAQRTAQAVILGRAALASRVEDDASRGVAKALRTAALAGRGCPV